MRKNHKKALRFAYDILCGRYADLPYVHVLLQNGATTRRCWIEPDRDVERPYLNEAVFADLEVRGYMERQPRPPGPLWLYRISPEGCRVMGWTWPLDPPIVAELNYRPDPPPLDKRLKLRLRNHPDARYEPQLIIRRFRRSSDWRRQ